MKIFITFLHFYQVIAAIPGHLQAKTKTNEFSAEIINNADPVSILDENTVINLLRANSKDFYWLLLLQV